jgi:hypothetical protein
MFARCLYVAPPGLIRNFLDAIPPLTGRTTICCPFVTSGKNPFTYIFHELARFLPNRHATTIPLSSASSHAYCGKLNELLGEGIHQPADADRDKQKSEERPQ